MAAARIFRDDAPVAFVGVDGAVEIVPSREFYDYAANPPAVSSLGL